MSHGLGDCTEKVTYFFTAPKGNHGGDENGDTPECGILVDVRAVGRRAVVVAFRPDSIHDIR